MNPTLHRLTGRLGLHTPHVADSTGKIEAAVAIVLAPAGAQRLDVLFVRRAEVAGDPWSGQMAFPGGRREPGDHDLLVTACRETAEETGVELGPLMLLGVLDDLAPATPHLPPIVVRPFVFALPYRPSVTLSSEVVECLWAPLEELPATATDAVIEIRGVRRKMPSFAIGPHIIWGMTYRILLQLLELAL